MIRYWSGIVAVVLLLLGTATTAKSFSGPAPPVHTGKLPLPKAWTTHAYGVNATEAVLAGFINARGHNTVWRFKWGKTRAYGHIAPPGGIEEGFSNDQPEEVEAILIGLTPGTTYHYRIVAYSHGEKVFGGDKSFRTKRRH